MAQKEPKTVTESERAIETGKEKALKERDAGAEAGKERGSARGTEGEFLTEIMTMKEAAGMVENGTVTSCGSSHG